MEILGPNADRNKLIAGQLAYQGSCAASCGIRGQVIGLGPTRNIEVGASVAHGNGVLDCEHRTEGRFIDALGAIPINGAVFHRNGIRRLVTLNPAPIIAVDYAIASGEVIGVSGISRQLNSQRAIVDQ